MKFENKSVLIAMAVYGGRISLAPDLVIQQNHIVQGTAKSLFDLYEYSKYDFTKKPTVQRNDIEFDWTATSNCYGVRNNQFRQFLNGDKKSLLLIDNDMIFNHKILEILFEQDKDIIAPVFTNKRGAFMTNKIVPMAKWNDEQITAENIFEAQEKNNLIQVDRVGFGMILIKRKVLERFVESCEWCPKMGYDKDSQKKVCNHFTVGIPSNPEINPNGIYGEDWDFCRRATELGFEIWLMPQEMIAHVGEYAYGVWNVESEKKIEKVPIIYQPGITQNVARQIVGVGK